LIARSGTLTLAMARQLTAAGIGQSLVAHIGGDTVAGRNPHEYLAALAHHEGTDAVLYCGEIGGDKEYALAEAAPNFPKPVGACRRAHRQRARKRRRQARGARGGGLPGGQGAGAGGGDIEGARVGSGMMCSIRSARIGVRSGR
jgi:succinyl-CoA synthetase alpha subunit